MTIATKHDLETLLADPAAHDKALAWLQCLMDERYQYGASRSWGIVEPNGLTRLGLTAAEAMALGAVDRVVPEPAGPDLAELKASACARISKECAARRAAGVLVQFPDGPGLVQTRDEIDLINVTGVGSAGLAATVAGTTPDLYFRDEANVNHSLLPTQAVDFGAQVMQRLQAITKAAHDAKDAINAESVTTEEQIAAIEAAVAWPA